MQRWFFLWLVLLFVACRKEEVEDVTPTLLARTWKLTALEVIPPLQGTPLEGQSSNWYSQGCNTNWLWKFSAIGDLIIEEAPGCIAPETTGVHLSKWTLSNNSKDLNITGSPFGIFTFSIIHITPTKLVVQRKENVGYGGGEIELILQREFTAQ